MRLRALLGAIAFFAVALAVPAPVHAAEPDEAALKKKLKELEQENGELREKLAKAKQETKKRFDDATKAEKAAGIDFRRPTAVVSQSTAATTPPVAQPQTRHGLVRFEEAELEMQVSFAPARTVRSWRVHDATCEVTKRGR